MEDNRPLFQKAIDVQETKQEVTQLFLLYKMEKIEPFSEDGW